MHIFLEKLNFDDGFLLRPVFPFLYKTEYVCRMYNTQFFYVLGCLCRVSTSYSARFVSFQGIWPWNQHRPVAMEMICTSINSHQEATIYNSRGPRWHIKACWSVDSPKSLILLVWYCAISCMTTGRQRWRRSEQICTKQCTTRAQQTHTINKQNGSDHVHKLLVHSIIKLWYINFSLCPLAYLQFT